VTLPQDLTDCIAEVNTAQLGLVQPWDTCSSAVAAAELRMALCSQMQSYESLALFLEDVCDRGRTAIGE